MGDGREYFGLFSVPVPEAKMPLKDYNCSRENSWYYFFLTYNALMS